MVRATRLGDRRLPRTWRSWIVGERATLFVVDDGAGMPAAFFAVVAGLASEPYGTYACSMVKKTFGAEEARTLLPELLELAHHGQASLITKRGKPYAAIVSVAQANAANATARILSLAGSGRGLWGRNAAAAVDRLRDEWS